MQRAGSSYRFLIAIKLNFSNIYNQFVLFSFLAGFPAASPALIYGRAALLGLSGGEKSCHQTYVKCPKNEVRQHRKDCRNKKY